MSGLPGSSAPAGLADEDAAWTVASSQEHYTSPYVSLSVDTIVAPDGSEHGRAVVRPHGAVGVLAFDHEDRVLLVQQYRHPVRARLLEIPAGTLDVGGEGPEDAARRELGEETDLVAEHWSVLLNLVTTPGYSTERWTVYLATGLSVVPDAERTEREAEEADMTQWWMPFDDAVEAVLAGRVGDAMTVAAILAEQARRVR
ncbi:NUDIX domain-containing protein [Aeromicrobium sp. Root495]|uniref:NUDIX domain-containing protein n=1 Tax=Aeromicrobium sp. Root495 TaxID=1736550 RepID=UPI0009E69425|nr:NUDIX hydrolase [Aeromicrobium sp. Root495]